AQPVYLLFLLLLPLAYLIFFYGRHRSSSRVKDRLILGLRLLLLILLTLSLAQPLRTVPTPEQSVLFVIDRSASLHPAQQEESGAFLRSALQKQRETDRVGLITFGATPQVELAPTAEWRWPTFRSEPPGELTNIAAALKLALANLPPEGGRRLVLISDGEENSGHTQEIIPRLKAENVPVDVYPLPPPATPEALIEQLSLPRRSKRGEPFLLQVVCHSTEQAAGDLLLYLNERLVATQPVNLQPGTNLFLFGQTLSAAGVYRYRVELAVTPDTLPANNQAGGILIVPGEKPVLLVGESTPATYHFVARLAEQGFTIKAQPAHLFPQDLGALSAYSAVILNDLPGSRLSPSQVAMLHTYVHNLGGGLITFTGKNSAEAETGRASPLSDLLPVHNQLEQRVLFPTLSLLILIDTSGSMDQAQYEGGFSKLRLAKEATIAALQLLVEEERLGVLAFDSQPRWVVSLQQVDDPERIIHRLAPLQTGGSTNLYAALEEAYRSLAKEETAIRHILLLSDGISEPGDFETLAQAIADSGITISTVGIGQDADRELLANLAAWGRGRAFYTEDFNTIPQIFIAETSRILRGAVDERRFRPQFTTGSQLWSTVSWDELPELGGFVRTTPRRSAEVFLRAPDNSPVLAGLRYGLGRTVSFLSDLGENWARDWLEWPGYGEFWRQVINWVIPVQPYSLLHPHVSVVEGQGLIHVDALDPEGNLVNFLQVKASITTPRGETLTLTLPQTGPGEYRATFPLDTSGEYLAALTWQDQEAAAEAGPVLAGLSVPYSPEYKRAIDGHRLLAELSAATGGRVLTAPEEVFTGSSEVASKQQRVGPQLLPWIFLLFLLELALRYRPVHPFAALRAFLTAFTDRLRGKVKSHRL
ncbi:MAG: VWA domain-containing protein, partial [Firmicutes bacterium]|nr:VWA domain-containing protein [Bacillota bacterium]